MAISQKEIEIAKEKIYERLDEWIEKTKKKGELKENGIQRLVSKFPKSMVRFRTKAHDGCHFIPVTTSYEQRLRSIFMNSMSCVPPVIGECNRYREAPKRMVPSASEEKYLPPLFLERRKTASDNTIGTNSRASKRGISRQKYIRNKKQSDSKKRPSFPRTDIKTGMELVTETSPCSSLSDLEDIDQEFESSPEVDNNKVFSPVLRVKAEKTDTEESTVQIPAQADMSKGSLSAFEAKFRNNVNIWKSKIKKKSSHTSTGTTKKSPVQVEVDPLELEKEKRKSISKDGKLKAIRQQRKASRLRRMTIVEQKYVKMRSTKFRRFCRIIYHIVALFRITSRQLKMEEKRNTTFETVGDDGEVLSFDPQDYKSASKTYGGLTRMARKALSKKQDNRNDVDIMVLLEVINRMPFFQKYSKSIKRDLAKCLEYDKIEAGRVIIRQDHPGFRMYFISSGYLGVKMQMTDPRTGEKIVRYIKEFTPGCYFGELALMRNIKRTATVYSKTTCELLSMTKDNFNKVLRDAWDYLRAERLEILGQSVYFQTWEPQQLEALADVTELVDYPDNYAITGGFYGLSDYVYIITKGDCLVVRRIEMIRQKSPHLESTLHLPEHACGPSFFNKNYGQYWRKQTAEYKFVTMFTLHAGDYFAVGEDLTDTFIISKGKAQCLKLSSVQFEIQTKTEDLRKLAEEREPMLVSNQYLYSELMSTKTWNKYKQDVIDEIAKNRKIPTTTKLEDVPLSIRVQPRVLTN